MVEHAHVPDREKVVWGLTEEGRERKRVRERQRKIDDRQTETGTEYEEKKMARLSLRFCSSGYYFKT